MKIRTFLAHINFPKDHDLSLLSQIIWNISKNIYRVLIKQSQSEGIGKTKGLDLVNLFRIYLKTKNKAGIGLFYVLVKPYNIYPKG